MTPMATALYIYLYMMLLTDDPHGHSSLYLSVYNVTYR